MAMCHKCFGRRWAVYWIEDEGWVEQPCWDCKGTGEVSCCDGPVGAGDELPSDPMESAHE